MSSPIYFVEVIELHAEQMSCIVSALPAMLGEGDRFSSEPMASCVASDVMSLREMAMAASASALL